MLSITHIREMHIQNTIRIPFFNLVTVIMIKKKKNVLVRCRENATCIVGGINNISPKIKHSYSMI